MDGQNRLDEAIAQARQRANFWRWQHPLDAAEQQQLADWLQELRDLRRCSQADAVNKPYSIGWKY